MSSGQPGPIFALEVSEDGARIHTQVTRVRVRLPPLRLALIDVLALPALACLGQVRMQQLWS